MIRRHPIRTAVIVLVLIVAGLLAREVRWAFTAKTGGAEDFVARTNALVETGEADSPGENGWPLLLKTIELSNGVDAAYAREHETPVNWPRGATWPPDVSEYFNTNDPEGVARAAASEVMRRKREAGVHEALAAVVTSRRFVRTLPPGVRMAGMSLPELADSRKLARLCGTRMRIAHAAGDDAEFVAAYTQALAVSDAVARQSTLIDHLIGNAIAALANQELRYALHERVPDAATLRALRVALDLYPPRPIARAFEGERLFALDAIQLTHTDDGKGDGRYVPAAAVGLGGSEVPAQVGSVQNLLWFRYPSKRESVDKANEFYDDLQKRAALNRLQRGALPNEAQMVQELESGRFRMLAIILPAVGKALMSMDQWGADHAATRLLLAIELHRAENGRLPATLASLVPEYVAALPVDPISGAGFGYFEVRPGADPAGRKYFLYSFGDDGVDNDGTPSAEPYLSLAGKAKGTDFIYNAPRPAPVPPPDATPR